MPPGGASWWIEYVVLPNGSQATPKIVQSVKQPQAGGNIEWVYGPYPSKAAAQKDLNDGPGLPDPKKQISARGSTDNTSVNPQHSGGILGFLSDPSVWLRIGEVVVGVVLLAVALNAVLKQTTGTSPVEVVEKVADKVPKVVPV